MLGVVVVVLESDKRVTLIITIYQQPLAREEDAESPRIPIGYYNQLVSERPVNPHTLVKCF